MHLILTSDFPTTPIPAVAERMRAAAEAPRIAWVPAHTDASGQDFATARAAFAALGLDQLECVDIDEDRDDVQIAYLHEFDIIYLGDGDPIRARYNAIRSGLAGHLRQCLAGGRLVIGAGAGAALLTQNVSALRLAAEPVATVLADRGRFDGLGAVGWELLTHYRADDADLTTRVADYSRHVGHDIVCLADGSAVLHDGSGGVAQAGPLVRYRNGHIIEA